MKSQHSLLVSYYSQARAYYTKTASAATLIEQQFSTIIYAYTIQCMYVLDRC